MNTAVFGAMQRGRVKVIGFNETSKEETLRETHVEGRCLADARCGDDHHLNGPSFFFFFF
jgi:hypothetical protein